MKKEKAITLIALVITIIVLLILAGVSIATLTGDNGILTRANDAKENTLQATAKEKVELEVAGSYGTNGKINTDLLNENLKNIEGLTSDLPIESLPGTLVVDGYELTILEDGTVIFGKVDGEYNEEKKVNSPKLGNNMQLVVYKNGEWIKDETNSAYSYVEQTGTTENGGTSEWANAKVTINGTDSYFVWIPRYAYKIDSTSKRIDVKFIKGTGTIAVDGTECKYANDSTLNPEIDYIIHPAFTIDANYGGGWEEELSGLWIGKFEAARSDSKGEKQGTATTIKVQPNVTSWRDIRIASCNK